MTFEVLAEVYFMRRSYKAESAKKLAPLGLVPLGHFSEISYLQGIVCGYSLKKI